MLLSMIARSCCIGATDRVSGELRRLAVPVTQRSASSVGTVCVRSFLTDAVEAKLLGLFDRLYC